MVVSDRIVERTAGGIVRLERLTGVLLYPFADLLRRSLGILACTLHWPSAQAGAMQGRTIRYVTMSTHQSDILLERSTLLFRRENQGESFDDDVSALRDQVGAGRREQTEPEQAAEEDQTTYSPPRQSWTPVTQTPQATSYQPQTPPPATTPEPPEDGAASVIAQDTRWDGTVQSSGSIHVHGNVQGEIHAEGDVFIAEGASVTAAVRSGGVTVAGRLEGTVVCSGRFEVMPTGYVSADVTAPRLVVHEGAVVVGKLSMSADEQGND